MSLAAFRRTTSRSVCLLCSRSITGVNHITALRWFAARSRPAAANHVRPEQPQAADLSQTSSPLSSSAPAPTRRGRPRKVAAQESLPTPLSTPPQQISILQMLLPEQVDEEPNNSPPQQQSPQLLQAQQADDSKQAESAAVTELEHPPTAVKEASTDAADEGEPSVLELLRPQPETESDALSFSSPHSPHSAAAHSASTISAAPADDVTDSLPAGSLHDPNAPSEELLSPDASITDADFERFMTEPLQSPPSYEEMERQVDSLLRLEVRGRRMFPLYMRDQLKLATLTHMRDVISQLFPQLSPASASNPTTSALSVPVTQHTLHSRLFTYLVKRGSKLARTLDERITILCPEAPAVGEKVPHPQWPEMTTVVRREFAVSRGGELGIELEDEERVWRSGKVKMRELFSGLGMGGEGGALMEDGDQLVDLDSLNVDAMQFREEMEQLPKPASNASDTQRLMYESQLEARQQAVAFIKERIRQLQKQREAYVKEGRAAGGDNEENAKTQEGGTHVLSVVYRFDGEGEEFEVRYPLSKRDVERMQLFEEADDAVTVIPMNTTPIE